MQMVDRVWEFHISLHLNILGIFEYFLNLALFPTFSSSVLFRLEAYVIISSTFVVFMICLNFPVAQIFGLPGFINE